MLASGEPVSSRGPVVKESRLIYRFEDIEVDASRGCLKRGGEEQHLRSQSFHLLLYLLNHRQTLVRKEELIENFWQGAAVTDNTVVQCIKEIRRALGDHPRDPRFIKTFHKIGYRFIAPVAEELAQPVIPPAMEGDGTRASGLVADRSLGNLVAGIRRFRWNWIFLALSAGGLTVLGGLWLRDREPRTLMPLRR